MWVTLHLEFTLIFILMANGHSRLLWGCLLNGIEYVSKFAVQSVFGVVGKERRAFFLWNLPTTKIFTA